MCREGAPSACHQLDGEGLIKHTRMLLLIIAAAGDFEAVLTKVQCGWEVLFLFTEPKEVSVVQRDTKALCLGSAQTHPCDTVAMGWDQEQGPFAGPVGEERFCGVNFL